MLVDDAERRQREAALDAAILLFLRSPEVQPGTFSTRDAQAAIAAAMLLHLGTAYQHGGGLIWDERLPPFVGRENWAKQYSQRFAKQLVVRLKDDLPLAKTDPAAFQDLRGRGRSEAIAITELTKAFSAGKLDAAAELGEYLGKSPQLIWVTERDERVCSVCRPLHLKPERVWRPRFPDGPPAHPNCRCDLDLS